jgi:hypothetical protein
VNKCANQKRGESPWPVIVAVVVCLAIAGLVVFLNIVRTEGWEGLWNKKKEYITNTQPGAGPVLDEAEKRVKDGIK